MSKDVLKSDLTCIPIQKMVFEKVYPGVKVNDFAPRNQPGERMREDGVLYVNDICYGDKYPNSHVDIWYGNGDRCAKRPTIIYIHGGGMIFGDKVTGDPMAADAQTDVNFYAEMAKRGFNVIGVNYALAPEYRFPVQLEQVDQMLRYLTAHQEELGLDMDRVFLGGGSAGADFAEIYGAMLCNPAYAEKVGVKPSISTAQIQGLLLDEAALTVAHFEENMNAMFGCWVGEDEPSKKPIAEVIDATKWIGDRYIPSFINTSNQEIWFMDSAQALAEVLQRNGTEYEYFHRGPECDTLNHGYMQLFATNPYAKECFEHMMAFVEKRV